MSSLAHFIHSFPLPSTEACENTLKVSVLALLNPSSQPLTSLKQATSSYERELVLCNLPALPWLWGRREAFSWEEQTPRWEQMGIERSPGSLEHRIWGPGPPQLMCLMWQNHLPCSPTSIWKINVIQNMVLSSKQRDLMPVGCSNTTMNIWHILEAGQVLKQPPTAPRLPLPSRILYHCSGSYLLFRFI